MISFAGIFLVVLAQSQNRFFVEHLPVAGYVRCLKEKEWKKLNSVILLYSLWHFFCGIARYIRGNKNKLRTFQPQKWNKIKNSQSQTKFTGSYKKRVYYSWYSDEGNLKRQIKIQTSWVALSSRKHDLS